ncbi:MAG: hypothetical protein ACI8RD_011559 [Bacillariaceae sp.]|jgi:hypothetical protein
MQRTIVYFQATKMAKSQKIITHHLYNQKKNGTSFTRGVSKKIDARKFGKTISPDRLERSQIDFSFRIRSG